MERVVLRGLEHLSRDEFSRFCHENELYRIERQADGCIVLDPPAHYFTGGINSKLIIFLGIWNIENKLGKTFDSNTGFTLPDTSVLSPDAAWVSNERDKNLPQSEKHKFAMICPDFIVELRSKTDPKKTLLEKMDNWMENGVKLAWMIDPYEEKAYVYRPGQKTEIIDNLDDKLSGEDLLPGFELELKHFKK